jgi:threonine dehydrogenase-like Zn-dependent dehydrogenase
MKAIAVFTGKTNTVHLTEVTKPTLDQIPNGRGVLVKVLRVGVDGTDKEINAAAMLLRRDVSYFNSTVSPKKGTRHF